MEGLNWFSLMYSIMVLYICMVALYYMNKSNKQEDFIEKMSRNYMTDILKKDIEIIELNEILKKREKI